MLMRKMSAPASHSLRIIALSEEGGPRVARILIRRSRLMAWSRALRLAADQTRPEAQHLESQHSEVQHLVPEYLVAPRLEAPCLEVRNLEMRRLARERPGAASAYCHSADQGHCRWVPPFPAVQARVAALAARWRRS